MAGDLNIDLEALFQGITKFRSDASPFRRFVGCLETTFQRLQEGTWLHREKQYRVDVSTLMIEA